MRKKLSMWPALFITEKRFDRHRLGILYILNKMSNMSLVND